MPPHRKPPFRADHVGSLLRPKSLLGAREQRARNEISAAELKQRDGETELKPPGPVVTGKLGLPPGGIFVEDFKFLASVVAGGITPKITVPSPSTMHFRGGRTANDAYAYPDIGEFYTDLARVYAQEVRAFADAGCRYLQIDEVNFAFLCDPKLRAEVRTTIGEEPDRLPHMYAALINASVATRPADACISAAAMR
ncbi:MAG: hypothetical protein JO230_29400 [Xanthobacteraceae bacterium]|nr:hypothetical protein [Xanthobacteraceae bacterium]